jgi:hypothetical protein
MLQTAQATHDQSLQQELAIYNPLHSTKLTQKEKKPTLL